MADTCYATAFGGMTRVTLGVEFTLFDEYLQTFRLCPPHTRLSVMRTAEHAPYITQMLREKKDK
jgi:hypothetical protein